jgi:putative transposase
MARLPRYTIINQPQHIIQRSRSGQSLFFEEQDYQYYHDCLEAAAFNYRLKVHAYALLPGQVHILASPGNTDSIARTVQSIGRNYVQYYNESYSGAGTLWEGRYRATVIDDKPYLLTCSRYIELSPVRAELVANPRDYRWSSYAHNALGQVDEMISPHREYLQLGRDDRERAKAYRSLFKQKISDDTVWQITESTLKGWALGDSKFAARMEKISGRRATQLPKGRPRRQ